MEAAASQEPDFTEGVAASRSKLSSLSNAAPLVTISALNEHLHELAKQFFLVFLHYRGRPPNSVNPVRSIRNLLTAAYEDLEVYYLTPNSILASSAEDTQRSFLKWFQEDFLSVYAEIMDALDLYEQALTTFEEKAAPSKRVSEIRAATEWKLECREALLKVLEGFQTLLSGMSKRGPLEHR